MNFNDVETKLINLALNSAAHEGEITNAAQMLFRQLRKRGVTAQQFSSNGQNASGGIRGTDYNNMMEYYRGQIRAMDSRNNSLIAENSTLSQTNRQLRTEVEKLRSDIAAGVAAGVNFRASSTTTGHAKAKGRYFGGILLTDKEQALFVRIAKHYDLDGSTITVRRICKTNSEQGAVQGLIKKGLVEKRYNHGLGLTEAGLAHFREYHKA